MGLLGDAMQSALEPGTGHKFVLAMNAVLVTLLVVIGTTIASGMEDSFHMYVFLFLAVGLTLSINWFVLEARSLQERGELNLGSSSIASKEVLKKTD